MRFRSNSVAISIAVLAWWASVFLPLAHGSMAAAPGGDVARWCGTPSEARVAAYAALPAEVRAAIERSSGEPADAPPDCQQACGAAMQMAGSAELRLPSLPAQSAVPLPAGRGAADDSHPARLPPARGPPVSR
jgi:hypothetical protein